jgi:predicted dehydrogenase
LPFQAFTENNMKPFQWAIIGPGRIAHRFAEAVTKLEGTRITIVQGRDHARADAFAREWRRDSQSGDQSIRVTTSIEEVLNADDVDAVYIATPHPFHAEAIRACLRAKKPVLSEKPMVTDAATARELATLARDQNTFLMEAVWTRFLPIYATVRDWIASGKIGRVRAMQSSFCFNALEHAPIDPHSRLFDPALAGGTLLDIGIYNLTVTRWVMQCAFSQAPTLREMDVRAKIGPTGVDHELAATLSMNEGVTSQFVTSFESSAENAFHIYGERGVITIHPYFWEATRATLSKHREVIEHIEKPLAINGFEGEILEVMRCIREGRIESDVISHAETIATLEWMDAIRAKIGVRYPFDRV